MSANYRPCRREAEINGVCFFAEIGGIDAAFGESGGGLMSKYRRPKLAEGLAAPRERRVIALESRK